MEAEHGNSSVLGRGESGNRSRSRDDGGDGDAAFRSTAKQIQWPPILSFVLGILS